MAEHGTGQSASWPGRRRRKQVLLTVLNNEPMARLSEQRLRQAGIPCLSRCLRGGPGIWGSAYNLPHDLYVYEEDEMRARDVLDLAPLELAERERQGEARQSRAGSPLAVAVIVAVVLVLLIFVPLFLRIVG